MFNRGGFPGQRPMGHGPMNQSGMGHPGMNMSGVNMSGMNMSGMNMSGMGMSPMNQPNMNLSGMNHPGMNHQRMGHPGMTHPNVGLSGMNQPNMNQPNMNLNRMNHPNMNQGGGRGFHPEMKSQGFGMRPMDTAGSFGGGNTDPIGMKGMPMIPPMHQSSDRLMGPQVLPQRFPSPNVPVHQGQPRMPSQNQEIPSIVNRVLTHSSERMIGKPKAPLQEPAHHMKEKQWDNLSVFGNVGQEMGMKSIPSGPAHDQVSNAQNRYTNESASSILESFGLSNEDLEELSRYPDDQLTPSNMPGILRDIRLRKMNRTSSVPDPAAGRRPGGETVPSKVIDYGHSSKYQFNDAANPARSYDLPRTEQKPLPVPKETAAPSNTKLEMTPEQVMDNKIPTISGSRKPMWTSSKPDRSNNKTLVGEETKAPVDVSAVTVSNVEKSIISIQADATVIPDVAAPVQSELKPAAQVAPGVGQVAYQQPAETPAARKGSWAPVLSQEEAQKKKSLPTPSMMNDYYAASPRIFPHICSLCNVECRHLKDWIKHQNNASHIESCRNLRQQYPEWNPQVLSSVRNESKKDDLSSKNSKSKSNSPRRSRRSGSRHRARKSRSRSPRSSGRRSRSRSPRRSRYSPRRSRSPRRGPRSPRRSHSPRRYRRPSRSNSPDKRAVDAAVQSFIEATKLKSGEKAKSTKPASNGKKLPPNSSAKSKKPASSAPAPKKSGSSAPKPGGTSSSSSSSKKPSNSNNGSDKKPSSSNAARKPTSSSSTAKNPTSSSSNYKKPVVSTGAKKTTMSTSSGKKPPAGNRKTPSSPTATSKETCNPLNKFASKNNSGKIIHVTNLPDSGYTDQDILKIVQPFGKVCDILIVRSKNEAFMETNFKEAATAAIKFSESTPVLINNQRITLSLAGQSKKPVKSAEKGGKSQEQSAKASAKTGAPEKEDTDKKLESKHDIEVPSGFIKRYMLVDPPMKPTDKCVVLISNLPEAQYTVDEITNLAKPFGGVNDVLIVANHRKAYMELSSRNSVDSMIKYYDAFPTYLGGNLLTICNAQRYKDLKNEDLIFADLIEQASYKITPSIYEKFVYLSNLPEKAVEDFEIIRIGIRFGKVEHHMFLSNKKKAILHLHNASAAKAMHSFLSQYPCSIGENIIQCSLPSRTQIAEDEYITYIEEDKPSTESVIEKTESAAAESKEPKKKKGKNSNPDDKESKVEAVSSSPASQSEMDVDNAECETASAPPPSTKDDVKSDTSSGQGPTKPPSSGPFSSCYMVVATEDDGDEEEAAEAPEAPDSSPLYVQAEPEKQHHEPHPVSHQVSEALDVLVSVESDEEESEEQHLVILGKKQDPQPLPVPENDKLLDTETSAIEGTNESEGKEAPGDAQNVTSQPSQLPKAEDVGNKTAENSNIEGPSTDKVQDSSTESSNVEETKDSNVIPAGKTETSASKAEESKLKPISTSDEGSKSVEEKPEEEKSKPSEEKPGQPVPTKGKDESEVPEMGQSTAPSSVSMIRTTKYNAQKGEISVTVTLDSQKSKTVESRKWTSRERGTTAHESSTTRSSSNRSSPADSASSYTKSASSFSQKKNTGKYGSSQPERDSKDITRQREREARSNSRKDDRLKGSSSSRYTRSSKSNNRSPRSKEEEEETFPFNLDEFVTVDEIVEEHVDPKDRAEKPEEKPDTAKKGKRKENEPLPLDTKKSRLTSTDSHEPSFVTLDEVGDEEEPTGVQENVADQTAQSLVTLDEVHVEDGPPASTKDEQMLMTLDEISDDDDAQDSTVGQRSSTVPEILTKDQLLTLDEVNEEDEEHTTPTEPVKVVETKLPEDTKETEVKEEDSSKELETKPEPEVQQDAPARHDQGDHSEPPLVTLDEVKAEDDEMSFADIEHQFLTVDEIGEEEEESEMKSEETEPKPDEESKPSETKDASSSNAGETTPTVKRGRPRKRPLPESSEENKDSPDTSKGATPKKTPAKAKAKPSKGGDPGTAEVQSSPSALPDKPESADGKSDAEAPAKKTKLESTPAEKTKLAPFNPSTPVGLEYLVPKTGYFCELCSLFYMDDSSKLKHCRSMRHYQAVEKHLAKVEAVPEEKSSST